MKQIIIFITLTAVLLNISLAQNFENTKKKLENPKHGQYQPSQYKKGYPYSTFYKPFQDDNIDNLIEDIRIKVNDKKIYFNYFSNIYNGIYTDAQRTYSSNDLTGKNDDAAKNAYYAKHAAFVFLMGFDKDGGYLRGSHDAGKIAELYAFRTTALKRLLNIDYEVGSRENIQYRVKEMVHYLQAYDLLKTAGLQSYNLENV